MQYPKPEEIDEKQQEKKLAIGQILKSEKGTEYHVEALLGAGGFGEVWKVAIRRKPERGFALKIEPNTGPSKKMLRLKCEVKVFEELARCNRVDNDHFLKMHDKGKTSSFKYIVMDLIWLSLKEVQMKVCGGVFTRHTLINIARQALKSIEVLHEVGYLHRDIKPDNFGVGLPPKDKILYMLDFGIAKRFKEEDGRVRAPRQLVPFMGTLRYASLEALCRREQSCRDDLEVWLYMMLELYHKDNLLWNFLEEEEVQLHIDLRTELLKNPTKYYKNKSIIVPAPWCAIIELLAGMDFGVPGDYKELSKLLTQVASVDNVDETKKLDWEGKFLKKEAKVLRIKTCDNVDNEENENEVEEEVASAHLRWKLDDIHDHKELLKEAEVSKAELIEGALAQALSSRFSSDKLFSELTPFRVNHFPVYTKQCGKKSVNLVQKDETTWEADIDGQKTTLLVSSLSLSECGRELHFRVEADGEAWRTKAVKTESGTLVVVGKGEHTYEPEAKEWGESEGGSVAGGHALAPMHGIVERILVKKGDVVKAGQALVVVVAMKMEYIVRASRDSIVDDVTCAPAQNVPRAAVLVKLTASEQ